MLHAFVVAAATAAEKPARSLVYEYTYFAGGDRGGGTINVDILGVQSDGALVVRFSEKGNKITDDAPPVECAVYSDTRVDCPTRPDVSEFEEEIGKLLGRKFINGALIDKSNHWRIQRTEQFAVNVRVAVTDDFTILRNAGGVLQISENRSSVFEARSPDYRNTATHVAQITYDERKWLPTKLHFEETSTQQPGSFFVVDITLQSDSTFIQ